jgi:hypothetical protein
MNMIKKLLNSKSAESLSVDDIEFYEKFKELTTRNQQLSHGAFSLISVLYLLSGDNYHSNGLVDIPLYEFADYFSVSRQTITRWIKELRSQNLVLITGSTNKRRICVRWQTLQSVPIDDHRT